MRKAILLIGGGILQVPAVTIAKYMGYAVIVTDRDLTAPAMAMADELFMLDIHDVPGHEALVARLLNHYDLCGVFTQGCDAELTVAHAAVAAKTPHITPDAARNCKNKERMRWCLSTSRWRNDVVVERMNPTWRAVFSEHGAHLVAQELGFPLMVKAVDNSGSRGATRVAGASELAHAVQVAQANSTIETVLIEECLTGTEHSVEIMFESPTVCHHLNIVDRVFRTEGAYAIELGHVNPTKLAPEKQAHLYDLTAQAASACGVDFGVFKADIMWTAKGPFILEVTARLSGGFDAQYTTPLSTGRNFIRAAMRLALGLPLDPEDLVRKRNRYAACWAAFPPPGRVWNTDGWKDVLELAGVRHVFVRVKHGDIIQPYTTCVDRPAFVVAVGESYDNALFLAQQGARALPIFTEEVGE